VQNSLYVNKLNVKVIGKADNLTGRSLSQWTHSMQSSSASVYCILSVCMCTFHHPSFNIDRRGFG